MLERLYRNTKPTWYLWLKFISWNLLPINDTVETYIMISIIDCLCLTPFQLYYVFLNPNQGPLFCHFHSRVFIFSEFIAKWLVLGPRHEQINGDYFTVEISCTCSLSLVGYNKILGRGVLALGPTSDFIDTFYWPRLPLDFKSFNSTILKNSAERVYILWRNTFSMSWLSLFVMRRYSKWHIINDIDGIILHPDFFILFKFN